MHPLHLFRTNVLIFIALQLIGSLIAATDNANWPRWRGPADSGSTVAGKYPTKWDASEMLWTTKLPGKGCSTPIVWNNRIYLTAPVGGKDAVLAFDLSGKELWNTSLGPETVGRHRNGSGSNPSAVTDGKGIFVHFKSGNLASLNMDGSIRWRANLVEKYGPVKLGWDHGTSPVLTERNVVVARIHGGDSWLAAFDKSTGKVRWKTDRKFESPRENDNGYSTPVVIHHEGKEALLAWGSDHLTAYSAETGKLLWTCGDFNPQATPNWPAISSPIVVGEVVVVAFGRVDRGGVQLHGIKLGGQGDVTKTHRLWRREDVGAFVPSPAEYRGRVYVLSDRGQIDCIDPKTGKVEWTETLPRSSSNFYASPTIAAGVMYAVREDGTVFAVRVDGGFALLAENKFADRLVAAIVPLSDRLLVRGMENLYCVANREAASGQ